MHNWSWCVELLMMIETTLMVQIFIAVFVLFEGLVGIMGVRSSKNLSCYIGLIICDIYLKKIFPKKISKKSQKKFFPIKKI